LNFIRLATPTTDDKRLPGVLNNTSGLSIILDHGITGAAAPSRQGLGGGGAHQAPPHELPGRGRLRRRAPADRPAPCRKRRWRGGRARRWSMPCAGSLDKAGKGGPATVNAVAESGVATRPGRPRRSPVTEVFGVRIQTVSGASE